MKLIIYVYSYSMWRGDPGRYHYKVINVLHVFFFFYLNSLCIYSFALLFWEKFNYVDCCDYVHVFDVIDKFQRLSTWLPYTIISSILFIWGDDLIINISVQFFFFFCDTLLDLFNVLCQWFKLTSKYNFNF